MGCGCKHKTNKTNEVSTNELNWKMKLMKIPTAILITLVLIITSPLILIFIWYLMIKNVFGSKTDIVNTILLKYNKTKNESENEIDDSNEYFDPSEYKVVDVDTIK